MDSVDQTFYEGAQAPSDLIGAYLIFDTPDGRLVLNDLMIQCSWGAQDPTIMGDLDAKSILATQRIMWRIKGMLNSSPLTEQGVDENE